MSAPSLEEVVELPVNTDRFLYRCHELRFAGVLGLLLCMSLVALACGGTPPDGGASETGVTSAPSDPEHLVLDDATMVLEMDYRAILEASELPLSGLIAILDEYEGAEDTPDLQEQIQNEWDAFDASLGTGPADVETLFTIRTQSGGYFVVKGRFDFQDIERELEDSDFEEDTYRDHRIWEHEYGYSVALFEESDIYIHGDDDAVRNVLRAIARGDGFMDDEAGLRRALGAAGDGLVRLAMECDAVGVHSPGSMSSLVGRLDESCEGVAVVVSGGDEDRTELVIGYVYRSERRAESAAEALEESMRDSDEMDAEVEDIEVDGDIVVVKLAVYGESSGRSLAAPAPTPESAPTAPPVPTARRAPTVQVSPTPQPVRRPAPTPVPTARPAPAVFHAGVVMDLAARESGVLAYVHGARIEVPADAVTEPVHVSIAEVAPPKSSLAVGRAFDFSVEGAADLEKADLEKPVTVHIPFEVRPGQDASSVRAVHWDEAAAEWEPVPGVVDESAGTIAVRTDRLSIFSSLWVKVEASCEVSPGVLGAGEKLRVVSRGTSLTFGTIDIYMVPSVTGAAREIVAGSSSRSEVVTVGLDEGFEFTYETAVSEPGEYRVGCRVFWESAGIGVELLSLDPPSAVVTVRRDGGPAVGADLRIEQMEDQLHPIYVGEKNSITIDVRNEGDERSGRFNLVADFISTTDGRATRLYGDGPGDLLAGREDGIDPGASARHNIAVEVPDDLPVGAYRFCAGIEQPGVSGGALDGGACLDKYVLRRFEGATDVMVLPIETRAGRRAWVALPTDWGDAELLRRAIDWTGVEDDDTLRELYKRVAGELAFRRAVSPGPERRHVLLQGLTEENPADIVLHITELCLESGIDCTAALERFYLPGSGLLAELPEGARDAVGFGVQSVSGALLFGDAYFTMLVNQALDLDQALETLDHLESLPLGPIWVEAVEDAREAVAATASRDGWTAYAAAIVDNKEEFLQFAVGQTVSGLAHTAAKKQLLHHLGIAGQKALAHALRLKIAGGAGVGASASGAAAAGPALFVASVWFASEVYLSVEEKKEELGTAALAAFINAAYSDPSLRGHLREAMAYAKYATYDNLVESEEGWQQWLSSALKLNVRGRSQYLEYMGVERERALDELLVLLSPESAEVDPGTLALAAGESGKLRARVTARSGRVVGHSGFEWTSRAPVTATVSEDGVVTGVAPGEAVIAVRAGNVEALARVEVMAAADAGPPQRFLSVSAGYGHTCGVKEDGSVACWGDDYSGKATPPPSVFTSVSAGRDHTCGLMEDGSITCWGDDYSALTPTPPPMPRGTFTSVSAGWDHTCAVREDGSVACWGWRWPGEASPPPGPFTSVSAGRGDTCGVRGDGSVACWGTEYSNGPSPPGGAFKSVSVSGSDRFLHVCGVREDGSVVCWGDEGYDQSTPPPGVFTSVSTGKDHTCGVGEGGSIHCWGDEYSAKAMPPRGAFTSVSAGGEHTCGVREDGSVACWGDDYYGQSTPTGAFATAARPPRVKGAFASVGAGGEHTCGVRADGSVACWGRNRFGEATPPQGAFTSVSTGSGYTCGVRTDDSVACWGEALHRAATPPDGQFTSVSARWGDTCGVRTDGSVACWGYSDLGQSSLPSGEFVSVSVGANAFGDSHPGFACGVRVDGSVVCWGNNDHGQASPPGGEFASVSAGYWHTCGVRTDGSVACWGHDTFVRSTPSAGEFQSVSTGTTHACGVRIEGLVTCWGSNGSRQASPPAGEFLSVSAGIEYTCGIRIDGSVACWGHENYGQATPPAGEYISVSTGGSFGGSVCALRADGAVSCWGSILQSEPRPPSGQFASVSAGENHACGVRTDGSVACWGHDSGGQSTPPEGEFVSVSTSGSGRRSPETFAPLGYTCGVRTDRSVACWGDDWAGQASPPGGGFVFVSTGQTHTCGVRTDGSVACWGESEHGKTSPPDGQFASVSAGNEHTCGARTDGSVACWGSDSDGQATPPDGQFASVSAGNKLTCGVRTDGEVACWGRDVSGSYSSPAGRFTSVSVSVTNHSDRICGVRTDGSLVCWELGAMIVLAE